MVEIFLKARARSLEVREVHDTYVRAWGSPKADTEHVSERQGLPEKLEPGVYGQSETAVRVSARVRDSD